MRESKLNYPICGANFSTEVVIPSVNPSVTVEAPYETENTWTLMHEEDAQRNYSWRDKGDLNHGHIAITTHEDIHIDVWVSAADDFELCNFMGIPKTKWNGWAYRFNDTHAKVQMDSDFSLSETATTVVGFGKKLLNTRVLSRAAIASIPVVGTPLAISEVVSGIESKVDTLDEATQTLRMTSKNVNTVTNKIEAIADNMNVSMTVITDSVRKAVEGITGTVQGLVIGADILYNVLLDIIMAWMEKSWRIIGLAIVRFVGKFVVIKTQVMELILTYAEKIANFMRDVFTVSTPRVQADDSTATYVGILAGLIGTIMGVRGGR